MRKLISKRLKYQKGVNLLILLNLEVLEEDFLSNISVKGRKDCRDQLTLEIDK